MAVRALLFVAGIAAANDTSWGDVEALSRFSPGTVPEEPHWLEAIAATGTRGTAEHRSLLRHLAEHESGRVADAARNAFEVLQQRLLAESRARFDEMHLPPEDADDATYAQWTLAQPAQSIEGIGGSISADSLLRAGYPRRALASLGKPASRNALRCEALAREQIGDAPGAVRAYAHLTIAGDPTAASVLRDFGLDPERVIRGWTALHVADASTGAAPLASGADER